MAFFDKLVGNYVSALDDEEEEEEKMMQRKNQAAPRPAAEPAPQPVAPIAPMPEVLLPAQTVVGPGSLFKGDIKAEEPVVIDGRLEGNITSSGRVSVTGKVVGNINCETFCLKGGTLKGDLNCTASAEVAEASLLEGNVNAKELALAGTLRGDVRVEGPARLTSAEARMEGDLSAERLSVTEGASLRGKVEMLVIEQPDPPEEIAPLPELKEDMPAAPQAEPAPGAQA